MKIDQIKSTAKYIIFVDDYFYQSTGYERPGEFGSQSSFVDVIPFDDAAGVEDWILNHPAKPYKLVAIKHVEVKKTIALELIDAAIR